MLRSEGGERHALGHREAEAHRLAGAVVRILAEDDDADLLERRQLHGVEDPVGGRVEPASRGDLGDEEGAELGHVRRLELVPEHLEPALVHARLHARSLDA